MKIMKIKATVCSIPRFGTPGGRINIDSNGFKHKLTG